MTSTFDSALAVALLTDAWKTGAQMTALPEAARPRTVDEGYDVQDRLVTAIEREFGGWKLGVGSHKAKAASGHGRSIAGRVLRRRMFGPGDTIPLPNDAPVTIELEVAFVLARDVLPGEKVDDPMSVVGEVLLTAELVRARFVDRRSVGWPSFAADNSGFEALVVGPSINFSRLEELRSTLVVEVDGGVRVRACEGEDITDPVSALADLIHYASERHMTLPKSAIVSTGTQSVPFNISGAVSVVAKCLSSELTFSTTVAQS
jgi:2-keto-4-pentenoate hydratase